MILAIILSTSVSVTIYIYPLKQLNWSLRFKGKQSYILYVYEQLSSKAADLCIKVDPFESLRKFIYMFIMNKSTSPANKKIIQAICIKISTYFLNSSAIIKQFIGRDAETL